MVNVNAADLNGDVSAKLTFITQTSKFNRRYVAPGEEVNTGVYEDREVLIRDARPNRQQFSLERNGFILLDHQSKVFTCKVGV
jgi:hypothetical protein